MVTRLLYLKEEVLDPRKIKNVGKNNKKERKTSTLC